VRRAVLVLVPLALATLLIWWLARPAASPPDRADRPSGFLREGESVRSRPQGEWTADQPELAVPSVLRGRVYDPNGRPVPKAEVAAILPKPYTLVYTGDDGSYAIEFTRPGRALIEARLTIDLAPVRKVVPIPDTGDPPPLDFHLKAAGQIFGEVVVEEAPVLDGWVDLYAVDLWGDRHDALDTSIENGFFTFYWEPPRDVPLQLVVKSVEGYMTEPIPVVYRGEKIDLGRIRLVRYPTLLVRMRLPDGTYAGEVCACQVGALSTDGGRLGLGEALAMDSKIVIPQEGNVTERLVLQDGEQQYTLVRDVELALDQLRELEVVVRPGPFYARQRLVDEHGVPIRARLRLPDGPETETGADGSFSLEVPHGGAFAVLITELRVDPFGWVCLQESEDAGALFDADGVLDACVLPLDRRVLVVATRDASVHMRRDEAGAGGPEAWWGRDIRVDGPAALAGLLSPPLHAGTWRWTRGVRTEVSVGSHSVWSFEHPPIEDGELVNLAARGLTVLDLR